MMMMAITAVAAASLACTAALANDLQRPSSRGSSGASLNAQTNLRPLAIAERDCAPWDGPAFGLWIPAKSLGGAARSWIHLRIWRAPEQSLARFSFPDHSMPLPKGSVFYFTDLLSPQAVNWLQQPRQNLQGQVTFTSVRPDRNVVGELDLLTTSRVRLRGRFEAGWFHRQMVCG